MARPVDYRFWPEGERHPISVGSGLTRKERHKANRPWSKTGRPLTLAETAGHVSSGGSIRASRVAELLNEKVGRVQALYEEKEREPMRQIFSPSLRELDRQEEELCELALAFGEHFEVTNPTFSVYNFMERVGCWN